MRHRRLVERRVGELRRAIGGEIERACSDAGISTAALARETGLDPAFLWRVIHGSREPSLMTLVAIANALGADLGLRLFPNTGPRIRDRHQAPITEALIALADPGRWHHTPEVRVVRPVRGWIDLAFHDPLAALVVATEVESLIRRIEQLLRWHEAKADALPSWKLWPLVTADGPVSTGRLLVIRSTATNRELVRDHAHLFRAAYPASSEAARAALSGTTPWPGNAILWADVRNGRATILAGEPRGMHTTAP